MIATSVVVGCWVLGVGCWVSGVDAVIIRQSDLNEIVLSLFGISECSILNRAKRWRPRPAGVKVF